MLAMFCATAGILVISRPYWWTRALKLTSFGSGLSSTEMSVLEKLPNAFWEEAQSIFKKYRRGSVSIEECFDKQRELSVNYIDKIKNSQDDLIQKKKERAIKLLARLMDRAENNAKAPKNEATDNEKEAVVEKIDSENKVETRLEPKSPGKSSKNEPKTPGKFEPKTPGKSTKDLFSCEECSKDGTTFTANLINLFEQHISSKHPNYKPFKCTKCSYSSHKKGNLNKHVRSNHKE